MGQPFHWGTEVLDTGEFTFALQIGDGTKNVLVNRITGSAASALDQSPDALIHQFLFSMQHDSGNMEFFNDAISVTQIGTGNANPVSNEVDPSFLAVNGKMIAGGTLFMPFDYQYNPAIALPGGAAKLLIDNRAHVNLEIHLFIQWGFST